MLGAAIFACTLRTPDLLAMLHMYAAIIRSIGFHLPHSSILSESNVWDTHVIDSGRLQVETRSQYYM